MNPSALGEGVKPDLISVLGPLKKQEGGGVGSKGGNSRKKKKILAKKNTFFSNETYKGKL